MPMQKRLTAAFLALSSFCLVGSAAAAPPPVRLAQLSDIHDGGVHYSEAETPAGFNEALSANPQGLIMTGDFNDNSHDQSGFYQRLDEGLVKVVARLKSFSGPIFMTLGNDDFANNYQSNPELLQQTYKTFRKDWGERYYLDELGDGVSPSHLGGITWITIDSVILNPRNRCPVAPQQSAQVLDFLELKLKQAAPNKTPIVLLMHMPPTYDDFTHALSWRTEYLHRLLQIVGNYPGQMMIVAAHYHRNQVFRIARKQGDIPVLTVGALASKYGYASNWRSYDMQMSDDGKRFDRIDYTLHYPSHPDWTDTYTIVPSQLSGFMSSILHDHDATVRYFRDLWGHHGDAEDTAKDRDARQKLRDHFNVEE